MRYRRLITSYAATIAFAALTASLAAAQSPARLAARSSDVRAVTVSVTPHAFADGKPWEFELALTAHTQPLVDDLMKSAALIDASGGRHAPLAWRGDGPGGHHRKGVLVFAPLAPRPPTVELQIQRAGEAVPRSFRWQL